MKTVAIIQARMGSTRLPGKVLLKVGGQPLLYHIVKRTKSVEKLDMVIVATTTNTDDNIIAEFCMSHSVFCFRGNEQDVLDRYYQAAMTYNADVIVRITADCPLLDPQVVDDVITMFESDSYDYVSNTLVPTFPDGLDVEVFSMASLRESWNNATLRSDREHVTSYMWRNPQLFRLANVSNEFDLSPLRWTVDEKEDLEFVRRIYESFAELSDFGMKEVLGLLEQHPDLKDINRNYLRNSGYLKSLKFDNESTSTNR